MCSSSTDTLYVRDILGYLETLSGGLGKEEGVLFGNPDCEVKKILVCWMANVTAIEEAVKSGVDLIIAHESLLYPYDILEQVGPADYLGWHTNNIRIEILSKNNISVIRAHYTLDKYCIIDDFAAKLGLDKTDSSRSDFLRIYITEATKYGDLIKIVKKRMNLPRLRATAGDKNRLIRRIGLLCGGGGQIPNSKAHQAVLNEDCDVFIVGETDNYGFHFATDANIDLIETSHEISENPGLLHFCQVISISFPNLSVTFYENKPPFVYK